jgi:hypothetical protein
MTGAPTRAVRSPWRTLGWPGLAGAVALVAAAWVESGGLALQAGVASDDTAATAGAVPAPAPPRRVPPVAERLAGLLELALREGVAVQRTEQRARGAGESGTRLHMPARGAYVELRRFIEHALLADPDLALESVLLRRSTAGEALLDAELVWWLAGSAR